MTSYSTLTTGGTLIFYRTAGNPDRPAILLLHGFPSSSHMFRELIPELARDFYVVAPDLPGFGFSQAPARAEYAYTFAGLAKTIEAFTEALGLRRYALYVFDYGAPVGFRLALSHPERVTAIVTQNGNAYLDGLSDAWNPIRAYWDDPTPANREALRTLLTLETTRWQYTHGVKDESQVAPESYTLDAALLARPGNDEIQLDLFKDYAKNVELYPLFQAYLRQHKPPVLAVWGKNDPFFLSAGAEAYRRDVPKAELHFFDTGHFALETHGPQIAGLMRKFLIRILPKAA
jgi:pimeloyl-ACP methyl ester carboxylesterase